MGWWPCGGCSDCVIFTEDFSTDPFASRWTKVSGDWSWSTGQITASTAPALAVYNTPLPQDGTSAKVDLSGFTTNCVVRFIVRYQDSDNYVYAEVTLTSTTAMVRLKQKQSGTESLVSSGDLIRFNGSGTLSICNTSFLGFAAGYVTAINSDGNASYASGVVTVTSGSTRFGLYTDGDGALSNFVVGDNTGNCVYCSPACNNCSTIKPDHLKIVISGLQGGASCPTADCAQADGTYILASKNDELCFESRWELITNTTIPCLGRLALEASLVLLGNGTYELTVSLAGVCWWRVNLGPIKPDCTSWSDLSLSIGGWTRCTPGTCVVTAV